MLIECAANNDFCDTQRMFNMFATEAGDFTARLDLIGLPANAEIFWRVIDLGECLTPFDVERIAGGANGADDVLFARSVDRLT